MWLVEFYRGRGEGDGGLTSLPRPKEEIRLIKEETYFPIQSIGDIYHLILTSAGFDRFYETKEYLDSYVSDLKEKADYTSQELKTDLDSYEATLDSQRALLLDTLRELEEIERSDLSKAKLIREITRIRHNLYRSL